MGIYYTKYAQEKFDVLREHKFSLTKEEVERILNSPSVVNRFDKKLLVAEGEYSDEYNVKVIFKREGGMQKIITLLIGKI